MIYHWLDYVLEWGVILYLFLGVCVCFPVWSADVRNALHNALISRRAEIVVRCRAKIREEKNRGFSPEMIAFWDSFDAWMETLEDKRESKMNIKLYDRIRVARFLGCMAWELSEEAIRLTLKHIKY